MPEKNVMAYLDKRECYLCCTLWLLIEQGEGVDNPQGETR